MATPPESPGPEDALFEFESTRARQATTRPVAIEELLRQTKFSRQEIRVMYRGFKQVFITSFSYVCTYLYIIFKKVTHFLYTNVERFVKDRVSLSSM